MSQHSRNELRFYSFKERGRDEIEKYVEAVSESSYRRGYHQSLHFTIELLKSGITVDELIEMEKIIHEWRLDDLFQKWKAYLMNKFEKKPSKQYDTNTPQNVILSKSKHLLKLYYKFDKGMR